MSADDYPQEVIGEIVEFLKHVEANPGNPWPDQTDRLWQIYQRWRDIIRRDGHDLLDNLGTMGSMPGLSSFGRLFLLKYGRSPRIGDDAPARLRGEVEPVRADRAVPTAPPPARIETLPESMKPPSRLIEAVLDDIHGAFADRARKYQDRWGAEYRPLVLALTRQAGHSQAAAEWAIHRLVQEGKLIPQPGERSPGRWGCVLFATSEFEENDPAPPSQVDSGPVPRLDGRTTKTRLRVEGQTVLLDGHPVVLDMTSERREEALCYLRHLLEAAGDWRSDSEVDKGEQMKQGGQVGIRWDHVRKQLPERIGDLIETNRRKGSRLKPEAFQ